MKEKIKQMNKGISWKVF